MRQDPARCQREQRGDTQARARARLRERMRRAEQQPNATAEATLSDPPPIGAPRERGSEGVSKVL